VQRAGLISRLDCAAVKVGQYRIVVQVIAKRNPVRLLAVENRSHPVE
jgi:mRNA-degrading endonuclease RelE of RelBE toxin-antitoxin system